MSRIFLDSGDPQETRVARDLLGETLAGQTTNPSLIAKHPFVLERMARGEKFSQQELFDLYKKIIEDIASIIPDGDISIEVYADINSVPDDLIAQGRIMAHWTANARVKLPVTAAGLAAARVLMDEDIRVNMTLCFSQQQAAAVYNATRGAVEDDVVISPFVGRLDDQGEQGIQLIANLMRMFVSVSDRPHILAASIRSVGHLYDALRLQTDSITIPLSVLRAWKESSPPVPLFDTFVPSSHLQPIPYEHVALDQPWQQYAMVHPLTVAGLARFATDWRALLL